MAEPVEATTHASQPNCHPEQFDRLIAIRSQRSPPCRAKGKPKNK
ncbi:MAG: hypothetical protein ACK4VN_11515 [Bacteroidales bacterium]